MEERKVNFYFPFGFIKKESKAILVYFWEIKSQVEEGVKLFEVYEYDEEKRFTFSLMKTDEGFNIGVYISFEEGLLIPFWLLEKFLREQVRKIEFMIFPMPLQSREELIEGKVFEIEFSERDIAKIEGYLEAIKSFEG